MDKFFIFLLFLSFFSIGNSSSQSKEISGVVYDQTGIPLPGAFVSVLDSTIKVTTDFDGNFKINIPDSINTLKFSYVGYLSLEYKLKPNQYQVEVSLGESYYDNKWFTIGLYSDVINSLFGIKLSNGYKEAPLIHFEDISSNFLYLASFQTDFNKDYTFDFRLKMTSTRFLYNSSIQYQQKDLKSINFYFRKLEFSKEVYLRPLDFSLIPSIGYQDLNNFQNIGFKLGVQKVYDLFYFGAKSGYFFNYFTYSIYFHSFIFNTNLSLRAEYERVYQNDFLNVGIHYTFKQLKAK